MNGWGLPNPGDVLASWTFSECGCRFDIRESDLPLSGLMCEHGNTLNQALGPMTGNVVVGADHVG